MIETMLTEHISNELILFFILYGITGVVPLMAAVYLLLRRGNAFAPEVTPPVRLRRWAAAFFAVSALAHVWWYLFYAYSSDLQSVAYLIVVILDYMTLLVTMAGTLLAMLQDRKRPIWPAFAAMIPFVVLGVLQIYHPDASFTDIAGIYILSLYVLFSVYMIFAVRQYGRWLNDNYADLENKRVWLSQVVSLACLLLFILYAIVSVSTLLLYVLHAVELVLFGLLLWRVETLPTLETPPSLMGESENSQEQIQADELSTPLLDREGQEGGSSNIEQLLEKHCVDTKLYLQHDLTLQQLAQAIGTNRSYLSQHFSRQGITYNTYINNLRINHFISRYQEAIAAGQPIIAQQLARESGYHSYSTFSLAFKQRMGRSVTTWMRESAE
ncbi:MAG: AraC family transcriptional regulator [Bacteroidaceae bacterium]|nr:AraC family transcriptional regulator [Bacteroidaceae bacterium]